jgi:hypothetical protein
MGSTGFIDAGDPPDGPQESPIEGFLRRGYWLHVRWSFHERRFHAYVDLGDIESSHNFMAETMDESLAGLERYLESHAAKSTGEPK